MSSITLPPRIIMLSKLIVNINDKRINRDMKPGDHAPAAHVNTRVFPDWYKPYSLNYQSEGYFVFFLAGIFIFGYSFTNDIKEQKGRKTRKVFDLGDLTYSKLWK
jgi:hypothetical protein